MLLKLVCKSRRSWKISLDQSRSLSWSPHRPTRPLFIYLIIYLLVYLTTSMLVIMVTEISITKRLGHPSFLSTYSSINWFVSTPADYSNFFKYKKNIRPCKFFFAIIIKIKNTQLFWFFFIKKFFFINVSFFILVNTIFLIGIIISVLKKYILWLLRQVNKQSQNNMSIFYVLEFISKNYKYDKILFKINFRILILKNFMHNLLLVLLFLYQIHNN
jgi:hypothetical protein